MAHDPLVVEILTELREMRPIMTQLQVSVATMSQTILSLQNIPGRVDALERKLLTQQALVRGGWWVWTRLIAVASTVGGAIAWVLSWFFPHN